MSIQLIGAEQAMAKIASLPKQVRFAASQAANDTAKDVQKHTIEKLLPDAFTLRSRGAPWWRPGTKMGFNIKFANKNKPEAVIGSQADWLKLQEEGGTKKARSGSRVAVVINARPSPKAVLPRRIKPRQILKRRAFIIPTSAGDGIFIREDEQIKLLYMLKPQTQIKPVLNFVKVGTEIVERNFDGHFGRRFARAIATAR